MKIIDWIAEKLGYIKDKSELDHVQDLFELGAITAEQRNALVATLLSECLSTSQAQDTGSNVRTLLLSFLDEADKGVSPPEIGYPLCAFLGAIAALELHKKVEKGTYAKTKPLVFDFAKANGVNIQAFKRAFLVVDSETTAMSTNTQ